MRPMHEVESFILPRITDVQHLGDYRLRLTFTNGVNGEVDLHPDVVGIGGVFAPLEDVSFFAQVRLSRSGGTIEWPNEVDFCPDVLYSKLTGNPVLEDMDKFA